MSDATALAESTDQEPALLLDRFVPYLLNQVTNRLNLDMRAHVRPLNVSVPQWRVLCLLELEGAQSIGTLASNSVIGQSTLSRVVDQLVRNHLVQRRPLPQNNRVIEVHLTAQGHELFQRLVPAALSVRDHTIAGLSDAEHEQLIALLRRMLDNLKQSPSIA